MVTRSLRAGETLLKPGDKIKSVYMIQSGRISLCQAKNGRFVEIAQLSAGHAIGDEAAFGPMQWNLTALALRDTVVIEVPLEAVTEPLNQAPTPLKSLLKALGERMKVAFGEVKTLRLNRDAVPCPSDHVAKVFGVVYHVARIIGKMDETEVESTVDWDELRKFAAEVFGETIVRVEDAVSILLKLGYARFEGRKLHLSDLKHVESFFDYYGSYYFKGGYEDLLKTNSKIQKVTEEFLKIADHYPVDRGGYAHLPYKPTIDAMKKAMGGAFEADQLFRIEQKGLFIKRTTTQDGGVLSFYRPDFEQMLLNWRFLRELEAWNEKGFVDMAGAEAAPGGNVAARDALDPVAERRKWAKALEGWKPAALSGSGAPKLRSGDKAKGEVWCSVCMSVVSHNQRECQVCGAELAPAKAS
jgi:CRP-like cAMP-binding protein